MCLARTLFAFAALALVVPGIAVSQDAPASVQGLQPAPQPFTFTVPALPDPVKFSVPHEPVAETIGLSEVEIVEAPGQSEYQPENSNLDLLDQGKSFDITCVIGKDGSMSDCEAAPNDIRDPNFIDIALTNVGKTVVGRVADDGQPTEGRLLLVTAHFERADTQPASSDLAMNGSE